MAKSVWDDASVSEWNALRVVKETQARSEAQWMESRLVREINQMGTGGSYYCSSSCYPHPNVISMLTFGASRGFTGRGRRKQNRLVSKIRQIAHHLCSCGGIENKLDKFYDFI